MRECYHLGMRNIRTIRQPRRIQLAFDLSTHDRFAPRYFISKNPDEDLPKENPTIDRCECLKISLRCVLNIIQWIFCLIYFIFKSSNFLLKIIRTMIFRCSHHCH